VPGTKGPLFVSAVVRNPASWLARAKAGGRLAHQKRPRKTKKASRFVWYLF